MSLIFGMGLFLVFVGTVLAQTVPGNDDRKLAPVINEDAKNRIPDQYIVVFKPGTNREVVMSAQRKVKELGGKVEHMYTSALIGFSVKLPQGALQALRAIPGVAYIEADQMGSINTIWNQPPNPSTNPPTGLDRTTQRLLPLDNLYTYDGTGTGVHAYVIDTGIRTTHSEFTGRIGAGFSLPSNSVEDCQGHGTHVAGTIGGTIYGIAKQVTLHPVRVFSDCSGSTPASNAVLGIDWVTSNAILPAVANISLQFGSSVTVAAAVTASIASGVTYAVSANNFNDDACNYSPSSVLTAITVGNVNPTNDTRSGTSNFGTCVDLFAPGVDILSAGIASDAATATLSGTSMASPHVAGVAARHLSSFPAKTPAQVWAQIDLIASVFPTTAGWPGITNPGVGSPNKLLYWGAVNDAFDEGDPHIKTVDGIYYDFQDAGEFVALRGGNGLEIQTRQAAIPTWPSAGVNTAIAARVGNHRVTWQQNSNGTSSQPSDLQLRVDGVLKTIGANGLDLGSVGRIERSSFDGIKVVFPDGTDLRVTPHCWTGNPCFLNVQVFGTPATEGLMGIVERGSWLKADFAKTWRVTKKTSLFDYAPDTSSETFTFPPFEGEIPPVRPENLALAQNACGDLLDENRKKNCIFDVSVTGDPVFAKGAMVSQMIEHMVKGRPSPPVVCPVCVDTGKKHARWWQHFWPWNKR